MAAPSGGGGGGGPVGFSNSYTGKASNIELIGNHGYAYNQGTSTSNDAADKSLLKFTTGNYYTVAELNYSDETTGGSKRLLQINLNGSTTWTSEFDDTTGWANGQIISIIIPAYTEFEFLFGIAGVAIVGSIALTGRIYR